jgi:hypothetical protein
VHQPALPTSDANPVNDLEFNVRQYDPVFALPFHSRTT